MDPGMQVGRRLVHIHEQLFWSLIRFIEYANDVNAREGTRARTRASLALLLAAHIHPTTNMCRFTL